MMWSTDSFDHWRGSFFYSPTNIFINRKRSVIGHRLRCLSAVDVTVRTVGSSCQLSTKPHTEWKSRVTDRSRIFAKNSNQDSSIITGVSHANVEFSCRDVHNTYGRYMRRFVNESRATIDSTRSTRNQHPIGVLFSFHRIREHSTNLHKFHQKVIPSYYIKRISHDENNVVSSVGVAISFDFLPSE